MAAPRLAGRLLSLVACLLCCGLADADTFEWTNPINGLYTTAGNWTNTSGVDLAPPNAGDVAVFNEAGTYTVTLSAAAVSSDLLQVTTGVVTFRENVVGGGIYNITTGAADVQLAGNGTTLILGAASDPATLNIGDDLSVQSGSQLQVLHSSDVTTSDLVLGTSGSGLTSSIIVDGVGSTLTRTSTGTSVVLGQNGATGNLTLRNQAIGNINGSLLVVSSGNPLSSANILVESDADLELDSVTVGASASSSSPVGTITVTGIGSTITQTGASTLTLGQSSGNIGVLNVNSSGVYTTGSGATLINATGTINVDSGTINFGGNLTINNGTYAENQIGTAGHTFADNATITVQNGGQMTLNTSFLTINRGQSLILDGSTSDLILDGSFTGFTIGGASDPTTSTVTIRNNYALLVDAFSLRNSTDGQSSVLNVESGGRIIVDGSSFVSFVGNDTSTGTATINLTGNNSYISIQNAAGVVVLGRTIGSTATINISEGAAFETDTEGIRVEATGTINLDDGAVYLRGDLHVRGGSINTVAGNSNLSPSSFANIEFRVTDGGSIALRRDIFELAGNSLVVDGPGSSFAIAAATVDEGNLWMVSGGGPTGGAITVSDQATLSVGTLSTCGSGFGNVAVNTIDITSSGTATVNHLGVGTIVFDDGMGYIETSFFERGELNIDGIGSILSIRSGFQAHIGSALEDAENSGVYGTVNLTNGGELDTTAGTLYLNRAGIINLDGGVLNSATIVHDYRSQFNFNSGTLSFTGGLTIDNAELLGPSVNLTTGKHLILTGATNVSDIGSLTISGGSLTTSIINLSPGATLAFQSGSLTVDGLDVTAAGLLGAHVELPAGKSLATAGDTTIDDDGQIDLAGGSLSAGNLAIEGQLVYNGGTLAVGGVIDVVAAGRLLVAAGRTLNLSTSLDNAGRIDLRGGGARIQGAPALGNSGIIAGDGTIAAPLTNFAGGEIRVAAGDSLAITGPMAANQGRINLQGGLLEIDQPLNNNTSGDILGRGTLVTGGLVNLGDIALSAGVTDIFGDVNNQLTGRITISGQADVTFWDDVVHTGSLFNVSAGSSATFFGTAGFSISGGGDVYFEADVTPGSSPGLEHFGGSIHFGALSALQIEIAGTARGSQYDALDVSGVANLGGTLDVSLLGGFNPQLGDRFSIVEATGGIAGIFLTEDLPEIGSLIKLAVVYNDNTIALVATTVLPGDYNVDGRVDAADYTVWRDGLAAGNLAADGDLSGTIDAADYAVWRANFGAVLVPASITTIVPEPAACWLAMFALAGVNAVKRLVNARGFAQRP